MIELNPLLIVGDLPESEAGKLRIGAPATAVLLSGQSLNGRVRYVSRDADPQTRTYRVEVAVANPSMSIRSGLFGDGEDLRGLGARPTRCRSRPSCTPRAARASRYVLPTNQVAFAPVTVIEEEPGGVWVAGLAGPVRVITVGQSYVAEGQKVRVAAAR